jgi:hypothetical protein
VPMTTRNGLFTMTISLEQSRGNVLRSAAGLAQKGSGDPVEALLTRYYRHVSTEDLLARSPEDLLGAALSHLDLAHDRPVGTAERARRQPHGRVPGLELRGTRRSRSSPTTCRSSSTR